MPRKSHYIVGIGASAGGLEAIHDFFDHMPKSSNLSFIIIQHLSPDYKSLLVELVSKHTHMKVFEAGDGMTIQKECIYVIPNNKMLTMSKGTLILNEKKHEKVPNTAIDTFFQTLATDKKGNAIAVILSGTGTDGTKGIKKIRECGGMVIVQDPATAKFDGMPQSAIASGAVDKILPPDQMPEAIYAHIKEVPVHVLKNGQVDEAQLEELFRLIYHSSSFDFQYYKTPTIIRRIERRMSQLGLRELPEYVKYVEGNPQEAQTIGKDFLINVTQFFRDRAAFDALETKVLPVLIRDKAPGDTIKIWVCGCSTGEEAYSLAILFDEFLQRRKKNLDVKIFATDIDGSNIDYASKNEYPLAIERDVDAGILARYFTRDGKIYSVIPRIRRQVVFARHNAIKDPPFIKNDLVSCRNMLIYINGALQQKILSVFHFGLRDSGYLFLGPSETPGSIRPGLEDVDTKWKIFRKVGSMRFNEYNAYQPLENFRRVSDKKNAESEQQSKKATPLQAPQTEFLNAMVDDLGYAAFFINENYEIRESAGDFNRFLSLPEKKLNLNILKMIPQDLSVAISTAIRKSKKEGKKVSLRNVRVKDKTKDFFLNVLVKQVQLDDQSLTMIVIGESSHSPASPSDTPVEHDAENASYVMELETELGQTRHNLQLAIEGLETSNEELQSSNEELLSANEELQSSNEELQSLNEELHTLNTEHQIKIKELIDLNDDLNNYFRSTDIGQVFIDRDMRVRKFNPASAKFINLIETDIGRPIMHLSHNIRVDELHEELLSVINTGRMRQQEVSTRSGDHLLMRIMPYVRKDKKIDGAVLSFVDISKINELNNILKGVFNASLSAIMTFTEQRDDKGKIVDFIWTSTNYASESLLGPDYESFRGKSLRVDGVLIARNGVFEKLVRVAESGKPFQGEHLLEDNSGQRWFEVVAVKTPAGLVTSFTDVTPRKLAEQKLKRNYNELITTRESLRRLNGQLEMKVQERTLELSQNEERFRLVSEATNDAIWDWDLVNNRTWWSRSFYIGFGYQEKEITRAFWLDKVHPDDRAQVSESLNNAINSHQSQWNSAYRFLKSDGSYANILDRAFILHDEFGTPYRMLGSMFDVTRLNQAEEKARENEIQITRILESNMIGMMFIDHDGLVHDANDYFLNTLNYTREDLVNGQITRKRIIPKEHIRQNDWAQEQLLKYGVCPPFQLELLKKDGGRVWVMIGSATVSKSLNAAYIVDISKQKESEELARQVTENLMAKKDEFMSIASHELKTPITSMKASLQVAQRLLKQPTAAEKVLPFIEKANVQVSRLTTLVEDLLDVTKIQAGKMKLELTSFLVRDMISDCVDQVQTVGQSHTIEITGTTDLTITADRHRLEQVLVNFLSNAIKYSPDAKKIILSVSKENNMVRIAVTDFGIGIPPNKIQYVFDRFFRVQESSQKFSGLGLGLYISAGIVDRHHGEVGVESEDGKGSTFWFRIPLVTVIDDDEFENNESF